MKLAGLIRWMIRHIWPTDALAPDTILETRTMLRFGVGLAVGLMVLAAPAAAEPRQVRKAAAPVQAAPLPPLPERKTAPASPIVMPPDTWSEAEIGAAKARCTAALRGLNAVVTFEAPIKEGACGTPAPIRLSRLGSVTFKPAALVNCGMLVPLNTWINKDLQPLAARQLGARITTLQVMSDYSCRTAFGRVGRKLSQHAYVDALDIRGFVTANGQSVSILDGWGMTQRDIVAAVEKEKTRQANLAQAQTATKAATRASSPPAPSATNRNLKTARTDSVDVVNALLPGATKQKQLASRLGGPAEKPGPGGKFEPVTGTKTAALSPDALAAPPAGPRARFLREAHAAACRIFGTTLGPEANDAHRNHFHVDMAERKIKKICD